MDTNIALVILAIAVLTAVGGVAAALGPGRSAVAAFIPGNILIMVSDREGIVEGFVRRVIVRVAFLSQKAPAITILDRGSKDATPLILERLSRIYPNVTWRHAPPKKGSAAGREAAPTVELRNEPCVAPVALIFELREDNVETLLHIVSVLTGAGWGNGLWGG